MSKLDLSLSQVRKIETPKLHKALSKWRDVRYESTMYIYGELAYRGETLSSESVELLKPLFELKGFSDPDELFKDFLKQENCKSYKELLSKNGIVSIQSIDDVNSVDESAHLPHSNSSSNSSVGDIHTSGTKETNVEPKRQVKMEDVKDRIERLKELNELRASGVINDSEFQSLKAGLIDSDSSVGANTVGNSSVRNENLNRPSSVNESSSNENLNGIQYWLKCFELYAVFRGRARRKEYWMFTLFSFIIALILAFFDGVSGTYNDELGMGALGGIYTLLAFLPSIAVAVRRLHDVDKSGWMFLLIFLPIVGWIWLFVLTITDSTPGQNDYGPNPKGVNA